MNTTAFMFMIISEVAITLITLYFFYKILTIKPKKEEDEEKEIQ